MTNQTPPPDGPYFIRPLGFGSRAWMLCGPGHAGTVYLDHDKAVGARDRANVRYLLKQTIDEDLACSRPS